MENLLTSVIRSEDDFHSQYEIDLELGRGKFGIVYKIHQISNKVNLAAKYVKAKGNNETNRVLGEIAILSSLGYNKYVLHFIAAFVVKHPSSKYIIVTEYLDGGELFERVSSPDFVLTESECIAYIRQICQGIEYIHRINIIHLDLKPENIVCCSPNSPDIKIIDFGLAREFKGNGDPIYSMCGTAEFVAPEIVNFDPVRFETDIWSIGVICFVLLTGTSPFLGESDIYTFSNISRGHVEYSAKEFEAVSENAILFIQRLLKLSPKNRPSAQDCLLDPWLDQIENVDISKHRHIDTHNLRRFMARRRWQKCGQAIRAMKRMSGLMIRNQVTQPNDANDEGTSVSITPFNKKINGTEKTPVRKYGVVHNISENINPRKKWNSACSLQIIPAENMSEQHKKRTNRKITIAEAKTVAEKRLLFE